MLWRPKSPHDPVLLAGAAAMAGLLRAWLVWRSRRDRGAVYIVCAVSLEAADATLLEALRKHLPWHMGRPAGDEAPEGRDRRREPIIDLPPDSRDGRG